VKGCKVDNIMKLNNKNEVQHKSFQVCQILVYHVLMIEIPSERKQNIVMIRNDLN
jgi:hypothetical protein